MFCIKCGNQLSDIDRFCTRCGAAVASLDTASTTQDAVDAGAGATKSAVSAGSNATQDAPDIADAATVAFAPVDDAATPEEDAPDVADAATVALTPVAADAPATADEAGAAFAPDASRGTADTAPDTSMGTADAAGAAAATQSAEENGEGEPGTKRLSPAAIAAIVAGALVVGVLAGMIATGVLGSKSSDPASTDQPASATAKKDENAEPAKAEEPKPADEAEPAPAAPAEPATISTKDFTFTIPAYWEGKVEWKTWEENGRACAVVYPKTSLGYVEGSHLVSLRSADPNEPTYGGDYMNHKLKSVEGSGKRIDVLATNWPAYYAEYFFNHPNYGGSSQENELMDALVNLSCGGAASVSDAREAARNATNPGQASSGYATTEIDYLNTAFVPGVKIVADSPAPTQPAANQPAAPEQPAAEQPAPEATEAPAPKSESNAPENNEQTGEVLEHAPLGNLFETLSEEAAWAAFTNSEPKEGGGMKWIGSDIRFYLAPGSDAAQMDWSYLENPAHMTYADSVELINSDEAARRYTYEIVYLTNLNEDGTNQRASIATVTVTLNEDAEAETIDITR